MNIKWKTFEKNCEIMPLQLPKIKKVEELNKNE